MGTVHKLPLAQDRTASCSGTWRAIEGAFLVEKAGRSGSERTIETYGRIVRRFLAGIDDPAEATPWDVHRFAFGPCPGGFLPSASTVSVRLAGIWAFYDFARRISAVASNPAADIHRPAARQPRPRGLGLDEVARLLSVIPDTPSGRLDRAMIVTAILTGLRRSELVDLHVSVSGASVCYAVRTKGGLLRRRELPEPAWREIQAAAAAAGRTLPGEQEPVFAVSDATFYAHLRRHATVAGLANVSPHVLRHTAAKLRRQAGASIEEVCSLLGHRSIATTSIYLRQLEDERDDGWSGVASALGLTSERAARSPERSWLDQTEGQDDCGNGRPVRWIGGVYAPLPRGNRT